jgi:hypothetical protein
MAPVLDTTRSNTPVRLYLAGRNTLRWCVKSVQRSDTTCSGDWMGSAPVSSLLQQMGPRALSWIAFSFFWPRGVAQFGQFGSISAQWDAGVVLVPPGQLVARPGSVRRQRLLLRLPVPKAPKRSCSASSAPCTTRGDDRVSENQHRVRAGLGEGPR